MKDLKTKSDQDLAKFVTEKRAALRDFRFGMAGSKTRDVKVGAKLRKDIAQALTETTLRMQNKK